MKVVNMSDMSDSAIHYGPEQALKDTIERIQKKQGGWDKCRKLLIIGLDDSDGEYHVGWRNAGMRGHQMLSLISVLKAIILRDMGH